LNHTDKPTFEKPDLSYLRLLMDNDTEIVLEVLEIFKLQTPIDVQNLELHTKNNDWQMLSKSAHKLKSSVGNLGMNQLKDWFLFIEINGKQETNLDRLNELVNLSIQGTKQLVKDIEEEILKLKGKGI
jgi:HPt (histidine-containing phosphotransfer) domain-containing protein